MTAARKLTAALALIIAAVLVWLKYSSSEFAEIQRSYLATKAPLLFSWLRHLPDRFLAERLAAQGFRMGDPVLIRIFKEESTIEVWLERSGRFSLALTYPICKWSGDLGPKEAEGDLQSPEGYYLVSERNLNPHSRYHLAINTGYPNAYDASLNRTGSALMIHGSCRSIGCYAIRDGPADDVYNVVAAALGKGQQSVPIHIYPFRMTDENLDRHGDSKWIGFWRNLAEGDRLFTMTGNPPDAYACRGRYQFGKETSDCNKIVSW